MLSLSKEQNQEFVIFGVAPERYAEVAALVNTLPHKWLIGSWDWQLELSCLLSLQAFLPNVAFLGKGEQCYLKLGPADAKTNKRRAYYNFFNGKDVSIGMFASTPNSPSKGDAFTFDPETGTFYTVIDAKGR